MGCVQRRIVIAVQSLSHVRLFATPWTAVCQASLSFTISWSLLKFMSIESMMPSNHLILCCPFTPMPSIIPSIRVFSNESALCIKQSNYQSFSFSSRSLNDYSEFIFFRTDWFDLLAVQGTPKSSPAPQFKDISSSVVSLLYDLTFTFIHDYWKKHSFDYKAVYQQRDVSAF